MLEATAKTLQCQNYRPNLCVGVGCMGWVVDLPAQEVWQVFHNDTSISDPQRLAAKTGGVSLTRPGDGVANLWLFKYAHSNGTGSYDQWYYQPTGAAEGHCYLRTE